MPQDTTGYPSDFAALLDSFNRELASLMGRLEGGKITPVAWRKSMEKLLAKYASAGRMIGAGLLDLSKRDMVAVAKWLKDTQLPYLSQFSEVIAAAAEYNPAWLPRAEMYGASTYSQYWEGKTSGLALPAMPGQGTQCLSNCKCSWEIDWIDEEKGDADCYWRLGASEHCQTCSVRAEQWNPIRIRGGDLKPESNLEFGSARINSPDEVLSSNTLWVNGEGRELTEIEKNRARIAVEELESKGGIAPRKITLITGKGDIGEFDDMAVYMGNGEVGISEAFIRGNGNPLGTGYIGGRAGVLAHEMGHGIQSSMTDGEKRAWSNMWLDSKNDRPGGNYLASHPSYESQRGWVEDAADSYRVFLGIGDELGFLGDVRTGIIESVIKRGINK